MARYHGVENGSVIEVLSVDRGGPAGRAGLHMGDFIVAVDGTEVGSVDDLHRFLSEWPIGEPIVLTVIRRTERMEIHVVPAEAEYKDAIT